MLKKRKRVANNNRSERETKKLENRERKKSRSLQTFEKAAETAQLSRSLALYSARGEEQWEAALNSTERKWEQ